MVDWARFPYEVDARVHYGAGAPVVRLRWYYTDQPPLPPDQITVINNRVWDDEPWRVLTVGELPTAESNYVQDARFVKPPLKFSGHQCNPQWFASGEPFPNSLPAQQYAGGWIPLCCLAEDMCSFNQCTATPKNGEPASQVTQYTLDANAATPTTPAIQSVVEQNSDGAGTPAQFIIGYPFGTAGTPQILQMAPGVVQLTANDGIAPASLGVQVVAGIGQLTADNLTIPISLLAGGPLPVTMGGTGTTSLAQLALDMGLGTAAYADVGTVGVAVPLLSTANTWGATQTVLDLVGNGPAVDAVVVFPNATAEVWPLSLTNEHAGAAGVGCGTTLLLQERNSTTGTTATLASVRSRILATAPFRENRFDVQLLGPHGGEVMRADTTATGISIGFLGASAVVRQAGDVGGALVAFGLMSGVPTYAGANVTGTVPNATNATTAANCSGNSATASALTPGAQINGVAFTGAANITVPAAAGTLTGATLAAGVTGSSLTSVGTLTGGATGAGFTVALSTSTLTGTIGTANLPGGNWVGAQSGEHLCSTFLITGAAGVYQATGDTISLPAAGTYEIVARVRWELTPGAAGAHYLSTKFRNVTDAADIANSETLLTLQVQNGVTLEGTAVMVSQVTVAGAKTIELYAARWGTAWTSSFIASASPGLTVIAWKRLY